jgi:hypothetical protein
MVLTPHALTPSAAALAARTMELLRRNKAMFWALFG